MVFCFHGRSWEEMVTAIVVGSVILVVAIVSMYVAKKVLDAAYSEEGDSDGDYDW
jgi:hypothetical protein